MRDSGRHSRTITVSPMLASLLLVVGVQRARGAHDLLVAAVAPGDVDPHGDRLVGLVGDDDALADLLGAGDVLARRRRRAVVLAWRALTSGGAPRPSARRGAPPSARTHCAPRSAWRSSGVRGRRSGAPPRRAFGRAGSRCAALLGLAESTRLAARPARSAAAASALAEPRPRASPRRRRLFGSRCSALQPLF